MKNGNETGEFGDSKGLEGRRLEGEIIWHWLAFSVRCAKEPVKVRLISRPALKHVYLIPGLIRGKVILRGTK